MSKGNPSLAETTAAHADLQGHIQLLSERLDFATRIDNYMQRRYRAIKKLRRDKPVVFYAATASVVIVTGVAVAAAVTTLGKKIK